MPSNCLSIYFQYFLWKFLYINIFFSYFVPHFSFLKSFFSNWKVILAWYIQSNSTGVTTIMYFFFYTRIENWLKKWISVDLHLMQVASTPSSECTLWFRALLVASCHEDTKFHFMSLLYTSPTWSNCTMAVLFPSALLYKKYRHWIF